MDGSADRLADAFAEELGADGWREGGFRRDIWYANLLHLSGDVAHPRRLVDWVAARRHLPLGELTATASTSPATAGSTGPGPRDAAGRPDRVPLAGGAGRLRP